MLYEFGLSATVIVPCDAISPSYPSLLQAYGRRRSLTAVGELVLSGAVNLFCRYPPSHHVAAPGSSRDGKDAGDHWASTCHGPAEGSVAGVSENRCGAAAIYDIIHLQHFAKGRASRKERGRGELGTERWTERCNRSFIGILQPIQKINYNSTKHEVVHFFNFINW